MDPVGGLAAGAGLIALGVMIHHVKSQVTSGNVQRNSVMGIRTKATMSSDSAWEAGHAAATPLLTATYLTAYITSAITFALGLALTLGDVENPAALIIPLCGIGVVLALLSVATVKANSAARAAGRADT
ncbi:SdpI family protein [Actinocorallia populi]|uniref:SdpI family protein n=1 Tax=Actinocorallia populi TaxID=2079200 RepID=UPI000D0919F5|nr:SdpI family protein [Actinocorallia populi]